jgi:outer membrane protein assembly factor BamB
LPWNAARFKFEIRDKDGNKALCKTIDNKLLQRGMVFINRPDLKQLHHRSRRAERRQQAEDVRGGADQSALSHRPEGQCATARSDFQPGAFQAVRSLQVDAECLVSFETRVDVAKDGSGVVRAKAWKKGDPEPEAWTIEVPNKEANTEGSPGLFSFAPQEQRAWLDNIAVTPNK